MSHTNGIIHAHNSSIQNIKQQKSQYQLDLLNQQFNARDHYARLFNAAKFKVGNNILTNIFVHLNGKIKLEQLNLSNARKNAVLKNFLTIRQGSTQSRGRVLNTQLGPHEQDNHISNKELQFLIFYLCFNCFYTNHLFYTNYFIISSSFMQSFSLILLL